MFSSLDGSMFIFPVCYHPTTLLFVDDDKSFSDMLRIELSDKIAILCFDTPHKAMEYIKNKHPYFPFTERCLIQKSDQTELKFVAIRNEPYNSARFATILISMTDYDMPGMDGIELIHSMEFPKEVSQYNHINPNNEFCWLNAHIFQRNRLFFCRKRSWWTLIYQIFHCKDEMIWICTS